MKFYINDGNTTKHKITKGFAGLNQLNAHKVDERFIYLMQISLFDACMKKTALRNTKK